VPEALFTRVAAQFNRKACWISACALLDSLPLSRIVMLGLFEHLTLTLCFIFIRFNLCVRPWTLALLSSNLLGSCSQLQLPFNLDQLRQQHF
jgi:hypothetical protein